MQRLEKRKGTLEKEYNRLDIKAETQDMTRQEIYRRNQVAEELNRIRGMEEVKARQRARDMNILEGDRNTKYFHVVANQRRREVTIHSVDSPEGTANTTEEIIEVATQYYKNLFRYEARPNLSLGGGEEEFSEEEVKKVVFQSYSDGAPGPDELSFMFYHKFWTIIKGDLLDMFRDFQKGELDIYRLNFALIIVIPKEKDDRTMNKIRPISLLNCSYKIFTKVLTNRIGKVIDRLICSNQIAFIKGRYILRSVITIHEVLYSVYKGKQQEFVLKLDYEKAYDKINWQFLLEILRMRSFGSKWIVWIESI
jgi:hypothetical protein